MGVSIWEGNKAQGLIDKAGLMVEGIARQNLLLAQMISTSEATPVAELNEIHRIVQSGEAPNVFGIGEQLMLNWNDGTNGYVLPWDIVAFRNVTLADQQVVPGMVIESHYALQSVQFDQNEAFYVIPSGGVAPGKFYFRMGQNWGSNVVKDKYYSFVTTESYAEGDQWQIGKADSEVSGLPDNNPSTWRIRTYKASGDKTAGQITATTEILELTDEGTTAPATGTDLGVLSTATKYGTSGLNNMYRSGYGYNRWSQSAIRQQMNSSALVNGWYTQQNPYDRAPNQISTVRGMMNGFDEAFLNIIKPVKVATLLNTNSDYEIGTIENTYDTFFLGSLEEEYIVPQASGEGEYWEYWKERLGLSSPQGTGSANANPFHIRYGYDAKTTAQYCRLRSCYRVHAHNTWYVNTTGNTNYSTAASAFRGCPACVIC